MLTLDKKTEKTSDSEDAARIAKLNAATDKLLEMERSSADLEALQASHESMISGFRRSSPDFNSTCKRLEDLGKHVASLKSEVTTVVRELKETVCGNNSMLEFTNPKSRVIDGHKLFAEVPELQGDKHLVTGFTMDLDTFDSYVALGKIPKTLAEAVDNTVPTTKAGRVVLKKVKK